MADLIVTRNTPIRTDWFRMQNDYVPVFPVAEIKDYLAYGTQCDDALDARLLKFQRAAVQWVERYSRIAISGKAYVYRLSRFPTERFIELPNPPLTSVEGVAYKTLGGQCPNPDDCIPATPEHMECWCSFSSALYSIVADTITPRIELVCEANWPDTPCECQDSAVRIYYQAGGVPYDRIPEEQKLAILMYCDYLDSRSLEALQAARVTLDPIRFTNFAEPN